MGIRGPKSAAELAIRTPNCVEATQRPKAPADLTKEQTEVWREIINEMPADWFGPETAPMLSQYCRHIDAARKVALLIGQAEKGEQFAVEDYARLLKMQETESRAIASLATKMRLSQQSKYGAAVRILRHGTQTMELNPGSGGKRYLDSYRALTECGDTQEYRAR